MSRKTCSKLNCGRVQAYARYKSCVVHIEYFRSLPDALPHTPPLKIDWTVIQRCPTCTRTMKPRDGRVEAQVFYGANGKCKGCSGKRVSTKDRVRFPANFDEQGQTCVSCKRYYKFAQFGKQPSVKSGHNTTCMRCLTLKGHGITLEIYETLLEAQGYKCAICQSSSDFLLHVDHDHSCCDKAKGCKNCVRGLLCSGCNLGIGIFKENKIILESAINYLERG